MTSSVGKFELAAYEQFTRTTLKQGSITVADTNMKNKYNLYRPNEVAVIRAYIRKGETLPYDSLAYFKNGDFDQASQWAKTVRIYNEVSLREFVWQMSRWNGFTVKNMNCIPAEKMISAKVCYRSGREQIFAAIRATGVNIYERNGMIAFCPENDHEHRTAMK